MAAWVKREEKTSEHRQRKQETEEADKIEVAPHGGAVASLGRFKAGLIGTDPPSGVDCTDRET